MSAQQPQIQGQWPKVQPPVGGLFRARNSRNALPDYVFGKLRNGNKPVNPVFGSSAEIGRKGISRKWRLGSPANLFWENPSKHFPQQHLVPVPRDRGNREQVFNDPPVKKGMAKFKMQTGHGRIVTLKDERPEADRKHAVSFRRRGMQYLRPSAETIPTPNQIPTFHKVGVQPNRKDIGLVPA